jgi:hypothetical protein
MSMFKTTLVTALLSASTAMAAPSVSLSANAELTFAASSAPVVRDHRSTAPSYVMPTHATSWSMLSASLHLKTGMDVIRLQGRQPLSTIRIEATTGNMTIDRVTVRYQDGTSQTLRARKRISAESPMLQLDLVANRSGVESISIIGSGNRRASYQVSAARARYEASLPPRPVVSFTGHYTSVYGDVFLQQIGNHIHGDYSNKQGTLDGYVTKGVAVVTWTEPSGTGRATFTIGANGKLEGTWGNGTSTNNAGEWDLVRTAR